MPRKLTPTPTAQFDSVMSRELTSLRDVELPTNPEGRIAVTLRLSVLIVVV